MDSAEKLEVDPKLDGEDVQNDNNTNAEASKEQKNNALSDPTPGAKDPQSTMRVLITATQSPMPGTSSMKSNLDFNSSLSSTTIPSIPEHVGKTKVSLSLNNFLSGREKSIASSDDTENESSSSSKSAFTLLRVKEMSIKLSHEESKTTTSHASSTASNSPPVAREVLQISTSLTSDRSGPKSEVVTVTTDYGNRSTDSRSISVDLVDQGGSSGVTRPATNQRSPQLFAQDASDNYSPPPSRSFVGNVSSGERSWCRGWRIGRCFRRSSRVHDEPNELPSRRGAPPTYSSIYAGPIARPQNRRFSLFTSNDSSFVAPVPPPSYAQAQGICFQSYSMEQLLSMSPSSGGFLSSRPTAAICPRCAALVVTRIEVRRSVITHVTALILCICGCWPCCMIPYCMDSCKNTDHYCPICRTYLGTYAPW